jgi:hypothetical protein
MASSACTNATTDRQRSTHYSMSCMTHERNASTPPASTHTNAGSDAKSTTTRLALSSTSNTNSSPKTPRTGHAPPPANHGAEGRDATDDGNPRCTPRKVPPSRQPAPRHRCSNTRRSAMIYHHLARSLAAAPLRKSVPDKADLFLDPALLVMADAKPPACAQGIRAW